MNKLKTIYLVILVSLLPVFSYATGYFPVASGGTGCLSFTFVFDALTNKNEGWFHYASLSIVDDEGDWVADVNLYIEHNDSGGEYHFYSEVSMMDGTYDVSPFTSWFEGGDSYNITLYGLSTSSTGYTIGYDSNFSTQELHESNLYSPYIYNYDDPGTCGAEMTIYIDQ